MATLPDWLSSVSDRLGAVARSRVGTLCLLLNTALLVRAALLRPSYPHEHGDCLLVGEPSPWVSCGSLASETLLYNIAHLPSWLLVKGTEWIAEPMWDQLCVVTARGVEEGLFVLASGLQWLVVGYLAEAAWRRVQLERATTSALSIVPKDGPRPMFGAPEEVPLESAATRGAPRFSPDGEVDRDRLRRVHWRAGRRGRRRELELVDRDPRLVGQSVRETA
jgi:hypothetical protein